MRCRCDLTKTGLSTTSLLFLNKPLADLNCKMPMNILSVRLKISYLLLIESIVEGTGSAVVVQAGHSWSELRGVQCFSD